MQCWEHVCTPSQLVHYQLIWNPHYLHTRTTRLNPCFLRQCTSGSMGFFLACCVSRTSQPGSQMGFLDMVTQKHIGRVHAELEPSDLGASAASGFSTHSTGSAKKSNQHILQCEKRTKKSTRKNNLQKKLYQ